MFGPLPPFRAGRWWPQPLPRAAAPPRIGITRRLAMLQGVNLLLTAVVKNLSLEFCAPALKGAAVGVFVTSALEYFASARSSPELAAAFVAAASPAAAFFAAAGGGGTAAAACAAALAQLARRAAGAPLAGQKSSPGLSDCKAAGAAIAAGLALTANHTAATRAGIAAGLAAYTAAWLWGAAADRWLRPKPRDLAVLGKAAAQTILLVLASADTWAAGAALACLAVFVAYDAPA